MAVNSIYLDHAAATPIRTEVRAAMAPHLEGIAGNPSSVHAWGRRARSALERARERTADLLGVRPPEVRFVRGGTESINIAVLGRADLIREQDVADGLLVRSAVEHSAVRESMEAAGGGHWTVRSLPVAPDGSMRLPEPESFGSHTPVLASVQWVNHETGLILPIPAVARWASRLHLPLHIDAVQALGTPESQVHNVPGAMFSLSGHKLGGPRSTGVLIVPEQMELRPRLFGGGQEGGVRPGTQDVAGVVGFARALEIVLADREAEAERLGSLRDLLESGLLERVPGLRVHAAEGPRAPHILNVGVEGIPRDVLPGALDIEGIGASAGSACRTGASGVSPVLSALYGEAADSVAPIRMSLGWSSTRSEVEEAIRRIPPVVERVRSVGVRA